MPYTPPEVPWLGLLNNLEACAKWVPQRVELLQKKLAPANSFQQGMQRQSQQLQGLQGLQQVQQVQLAQGPAGPQGVDKRHGYCVPPLKEKKFKEPDGVRFAKRKADAMALLDEAAEGKLPPAERTFTGRNWDETAR